MPFYEHHNKNIGIFFDIEQEQKFNLLLKDE